MPTFEIEDPQTKKVYEIDAPTMPSGAALQGALASMRQSSQPPAPPAPAQPSALARGAAGFYENTLAPVVAGAEGALNVVQHPLDTYFGLAPIADTVKNLAKAQWDEAVKAAQKAKETANGGGVLSASEALGHGLAAILPVLGPAAARVGEKGAEGDVAGMVGGTLGLLTPFAAKYGLELKTGAQAGKADLLNREAVQQVSQKVLAPGNPKYKGVATKIAPEILDRKLEGGRVELQQIADDGMHAAGTKIDAAIGQNPGPVAKAPILATLDDRIKELQPGGKTLPTAEGRVAALQKLRDYLSTTFPSQIPWEELRTIRDEMYETADKAKGYQMTGGNEQIADMGWAARETGGAIRQGIATQNPDLAAANAEYTFYKRLNDVLDPNLGRPKQGALNETGVTGGAHTQAAVVLNTLKDMPGVGIPAAVFVDKVLPYLRKAHASPAWQLTSAAKKYELAQAIKAGQVGKTQAILIKIAEGMPRGASAAPAAAAQREEPTPTRAGY